MTFLYYMVLFIFLFICPVLCFIILIQESKSSGLGSSFGSGDASSSVFGTSTPEVLKKVTAYLSLIFMAGCIVLSLWTTVLGSSSQKNPTEYVEIDE